MTRTTHHTKGEQGVAVIVTALALIPLMTFAAFGVDLASWYSRASFLQKAADAAALAGTVWMPNLSESTTVACDSLQANGITGGDCGAGPFDVEVSQGSTPTSLRVVVADPNATRYFSQVVGNGPQGLSRFAEAEYNLPIPLGSPLNYFGGDTTRTVPATPPTTYSVSWPTDYTTRRPGNGACNVGTSSGQALGRWSGTPLTYSSAGFSGSTQCTWPVTGASTGGANVSMPPPDHTTRAPTNPTCRIRTNGVSTGAVIGRWTAGSPPTYSTSTSSTGNPPMCTWQPYATNVASIPSFATTSSPSPRPCRVGYEISGVGGGTWTSSAYQPTSTAGGTPASGNRLCHWTAGIVATTPPTPPNPIDASRSPGFWAAAEGPQTRAYQGDAYSTRCYNNTSCTSDQNEMYKDLADPDRGFWYVIKIPSGLTGTVALNVFDASYVPVGTSTLAGDRSLDGGGAFSTQFQVYQQTSPLDFSMRTAVFGGGPNTTDGSCNWLVGGETAFNGAWRNLCNLTVSPGELYLLNVQTTGTTGAGVNGYSLEAVANGSHASSPQPALYAYSNMAMQNNNLCSGAGCVPPPATFYLAEVGPQYAGRTLVMELWDPGDVGSGVTASMSPMRPSPTLPRPVVNVPAGECAYTADSEPNARISGVTGTEYLTAQISDDATVCLIQSSVAGTSRFNGEWLRIRISIPANYTCTLGVNPELAGGSCWWGIRYVFTGSANDVTTWQARIEGNPVHLTQ